MQEIITDLAHSQLELAVRLPSRVVVHRPSSMPARHSPWNHSLVLNDILGRHLEREAH